MTLPVLVEHRWWRLVALAVLYFAQGLPFGLFTVAIPTWMASGTFSAAEVASFIGVVSLPWSLKLLVAPLMDRFTYPSMGRRRPWVLGAQAALVLSYLCFLLIPTELFWLAFVGGLANTFAATQDVAVDGMAIDVLPEEQRATANGFMFGGQYVGISVGASGGGYAMLYLGVEGVGLIASFCMLLVLLVPLLLRERRSDSFLPWSPNHVPSLETEALIPENLFAVLRNLFRELLLPVSIFLVLVQVGMRTADGMIYALMPIYTVQDLGWVDTHYNDWYTFGNLSGAAIGVLVAPLFDRLGTWRVFYVVCAIKAALLLASVPLLDSDVGLAEWLLVAHVVASQLVTICTIATMMNICAPVVAATQFAVYMATSNLAYSMGALIYASLVGSWSAYSLSVLAAGIALFTFPMWWLANHRRRPTLRLQNDRAGSGSRM